MIAFMDLNAAFNIAQKRKIRRARRNSENPETPNRLQGTKKRSGETPLKATGRTWLGDKAQLEKLCKANTITPRNENHKKRL
jgi:hypothetical protein